ncbi:non-ribosomal peptide synthetase [Caballeronia sordidicola]|nr:non-ribosomal peptide synthetase [Caballeronia sordidicola]
MNDIAQDMLAVSRRYAELTAERRAAFRQRFTEGGHDRSDLPIVPLRERGERQPLSHAQERLWFLWKLDPHGAAYNMVGALRLSGELDVARLRAAVDALVARHASLRTRFGETDGVAWQRASTPDEPAYGWHEAQAEAEVASAQTVAVEATLQALSRAPFDLERGPLFNVTLLRVSAHEHVLHLALHHIVSDGWSQAILQRELGILYRVGQADAYGASATLDALSIDYTDYALWQREWLDGAALDAQLDWWRETLSDTHPLLELPVDRVRRGFDTTPGARVSHLLSAQTRARVAALSRELGVTLHATLLAAWDALLYRYTGQRDIRIGTPTAGRDRLETEGVVGFFVNTLVIRATLSGGDSFGALVQQVAQRVIDAQAHQDVPFARIVDALQPPRSLAHTPLFQSMFSYALETQAGALKLPGLTLAALDADTGEAKFDLMLHVVDTHEALEAQIDYAAELFDAPTIDVLLDDYVALLESVQAPTRLRDLALRAYVSIHTDHDADRAVDAGANVVDLFVGQAAARGAHAALVCEGQTLSYAQLDAWSSRVADALARHGDLTDRRVVLCARRSPALVAGLLGILKAGGAYVPVDPDYPEERIAAMLARAGATAIVTDDACLARFGERFGALPVVLPTVLVDALESADEITDESAMPQAFASRKPLDPQQLAYAIFTSGSTGEPKQVGVPHGALAAHLRAFCAAYALDADARILQFSTLSFDVATEQLLAPLVVGATVVMRGDVMWDIDTLNAVLERERITGADLPTAYWLQWLNQLPTQPLPSLNWISTGGEALPGDGLRRWKASAFGTVRFDNQYGPTEAVISSLHRTTHADDARESVVTLGHAYAGRRIAVLDEDGNAVPLGALGELCIGGEVLARGYLGAATATATSFVPDQYGAPGSRLYRTGDLVRMRRDGRVDFAGRADQQLKLRGFRIEPAEIEAVLRAHPGVREALVTLRGEGGGKRLVGYVTGRVDEVALRAWLEAALPDYMVPQAIVQLDALPLMANGKVDRAALPEPTLTLARVEATNDVERRLLAIWRAVLGRDDIGVTDHFFEAGGDSILSLQIVARARQAGLLISARQVFEHPTVARLARVAQATAAQAELAVTHDPLDLTPIQRTFFAQFPQGENHWNQVALLRVEGELDEAALRAALDAIVGAHDALRLRFAQRDGVWYQQVSDAQTCALEIFDWREYSADDDAWRAKLERAGTQLQTSLDITNGPLVRAGYFCLRGEGRLLVAIHHLAVDGVSWRVLLDDLQTAYAQAGEGRTIALAASTPWSAWVPSVQVYARGAAVQAEAAWWIDAIGEAGKVKDSTSRIFDFSNVTHTRHAETRTLHFALDVHRTRALLFDAPKAWRTNTEEVLLAAFARAMHSACATGGVLLALEGHGREVLGDQADDAVDLSRTVGWFTTRWPLWIEAYDEARAALIDAKTRRRAVPRNGLNWGLLNAYGDDATQRALGALPQPRIGFNYLGQFDAGLDGRGPFGFATESAGESIAADATVDEALSVVARVANGVLDVNLRYVPEIVGDARAQTLCEDFERSLAQLIEHASQAQPELTAADFPLSGLQQGAFEALDLDLANLEDIYPATPVQQGLLFHSALESGSGLYVNQRRLTLRGDLDRASLRGAWAHVVATHAILRTQFETRHGGDALQIVLRDVDLPFVELDWTALESQVYEAQLQQWMREDLQRGFDVERAPLLRIALFARADGVHDLVWTDHHVLLDGWSSAQLMREVADAYEALRARREPQSVAPPYRDYVQWRLQQDEGEAWWREQGERIDEPATLLEALGLNTGRALETAHADDAPLEFRLDAELSEALRDTARRHRVTLNTVLQGAWALLLARYGNRSQAAFGVTVSGRPAHLAQVENMLGLFINSLPVWIDVPGDARLSAWLEALQQHNGALRQYEHTPLSRIQQWTARSGDGLFDSLLVFENYPADAALRHGAHGIAIEQTAAFERTHVPLTLAILPDARIGVRWSADSARFERATLERLHAHFDELLTQLCAYGDCLLRDLALPSTQAFGAMPERQFMFESVISRIAAQAQAYPDAIAVSDGDKTYSYAALERWSNRIAHRLLAMGVRADECVGLCIERSAALVAGVLGILKAGAAYVPLDPTYPRERLAYMLEHSRVRRVVADAASAQQWADLLGDCEQSLADELENASASANDVAPTLALHPEQLAYVIYTSGSTGRPKGVAITHANAARLFAATDAWYGFGAQDVWPLFHAYAFDVSVWELFGCLGHGGRLVIVPYWTARDPAACHRLLAAAGVTVLNQTPSAFMPLMHVDLDSDAPLRTLRTVIFAGEKLEPASLHAWLARAGAAAPRVVNMYGITETTVHASYRPLTLADTSGESPRSVIGVPIPDLSLPILDDDLRPVVEGAAGELHVGGAGLARGYLHAPGLTAARFVPDPFGLPGRRMYKSGDLARRLPGGEPEYIGRNDFQVKVRGYRIELGEIEAALLGAPGVREAAVLARPDASGTMSLVAYVVARAAADGANDADPADQADHDTVLAGELKRWLDTRLPPHMVPSTFIALDALPLTSNGKLDRRALPQPQWQGVSAAHVEPLGGDERAIAQIWQDVLDVPRVGRDDHFFLLGGHSLLAMRVVARAREVLGRAVALPTLFTQPVLKDFVAAIMANSAVTSAAPALAEAHDRRETTAIARRPAGLARVPLTPAQQRLWFLWKLDPASAAYTINGAVKLEGVFDLDAARRALDSLVARHESLRMHIEEVDGVALQSFDAAHTWQVVDLEGASDAACFETLAVLGSQPFDLLRGPVLRVTVLRLGVQRHVLHFSMHHIVSDRWSQDIVLADFSVLYAETHAQKPGAQGQTLAPLALAFGDYAHWHAQHTDTAVLAHQLDYWRAALGDDHPVLELPFDRPRNEARGGAGAVWRIEADAALNARVAALAGRHGATPFMVLLAAWHVLLQRYSGQHDIRVGVPVAGREHGDTHALVGCFVNTLVIRAQLRGCERFAEVIDAVRASVIDAQAHQDVPFAQVVDALHPQRSLRHTPLFQAMFNYAKRERGAPTLPGLALANVDAAESTARFDLTLNASDAPDALALSFNYATDVFDEATVARLAAHYVELLDQVLADERLRIGDIALARATLARVEPRARHFTPPFVAIDEQALTQPDTVAITCEGANLRYGDLRTRSDRVAALLCATATHGDLREERVGLCVARSPALAVGLIGIMKSGAAFVPLDPTYPADRLAYMLGDAGVRRVVADPASAAQLRDVLHDCEQVLLDAMGAAIADVDAADTSETRFEVPAQLLPEQLAYAIYTSGSTGKPKGVAISHAALAEHLADFIEAYGIASSDTQLQSSTINFDVALHELLPSLMQGGRVVMRGPDMWDLAGMSRALVGEQVSFARIPTAYWQQWLRTPPARADLARLRQITVGGEALPGDALAQWRDGPLADVALDNLYGPTETTVACLHRRTTDADVHAAVVSIGEPYPSRTARVIDDAGNDVPALGLGELCIGGLTMARGYLGRPGLTAERFVPDPQGAPGARMYRSGDLCRARADGRIDFLGRLDQQVKLRGFRIEPGEIEAAAREQVGVRDAVVELRGEGAHKRLVCYFSGDAAIVTVPALRAALAARLPEHMVPGAFVMLDALPLMQNGKVDRRALPDPDAAAHAAPGDHAIAAPTNERESALLAIWQRVLGREAIGVHDNFFEIGGDSILSLQIVARAAQAGWRITPRQLFEQPTVARLAALAVAVSEGAEGVQHLAERHGPLPLTPIQADFFARYPHGESHWNQGALLSVEGTLDAAALDAAVRVLIARHDALRVRFFVDADGAWRQRVLPVGEVFASADTAFVECLDLRGEADWRAALEREGERLHRSLDLRAGPLMRAAWLRTGEREGRFFVVIHHAVVDGVSWRVLLDEFESLYASATHGDGKVADAALAAPLPWSVWVERAARYARDLPVQAEAAKWQAALAGASASLPVARDAAHGDTTLAASRLHTLRLDRALTQSLLREPARAYRLGVDDVLLAALARTIAQWSGAAGALIALEGHGREEIDAQLDLSRTIGWFTTRFPVWIDAPHIDDMDDEALSERALRAAKSRLRAIEHKGLHWGMLAHGSDDASVREVLAALPVPRIGFNYLGQTDQVLERASRFGFAGESTGAPMAATSRLKYVLDLNGAVEDGALEIGWRYSPDLIGAETVATLAQAFEDALRTLVAHCERAPSSATAEDFPLAGLDAAQLDALALALGEIEDIYPATPLQQGLLFHSLLQAGGVYMNQKRLSLRGDLNRDALAAAWRAVLERHAILRTHFEWRHGGEALQVVHQRADMPIALHDWRALDHDAYEQALVQWRANDLATPFDLRRAPLMRLNLFARADGTHDLVWTDHHALLDGWSAAQLMGEVIHGYRREIGETVAALPAATPYRDYVRWRASQPVADAWWRPQLDGLDEVALLMPSLRTGTCVAMGVHRLEQPLSASLSEALRAAAARHRVTLNTLMQAAWAALISRHANRSRVAFGVTVSGRPPELAGIAGMLGLFINSLPVWVELRAGESLDAWLVRLQQHNAELRQHEHTPLRDLQRWAAAERGQEAAALFDTLVVFENYPIDAGLREGDTGLEVSASETLERTHYALTLAVSPGDVLSINWSADAAQLDTATLERLASQYARLLAQLADPATQRVGDLRVERTVRDDDAHLQATPREHGFRSLVERFSAQAAQRPDALAVVADDAALTYAQLDVWSDRVAAHLLARGVTREVRIGVAFERSAALIAALVGVLKAGAAYVPLDPAYPRERLAYLLDDAGIACVLVDAAGAAALAPLQTARAFVLHDAGAMDSLPPAGASWRSRMSRVLPDQLAYVIYTSGSTGQPKGVGISQRSAARLFDACGDTFAFSPDDVWSMCHSYAFDFSVWEIFGALTHGARLAVAPAALTRDIEALHGWLDAQGVSVLNQTPSAFAPLMRVDEARADGFARLRVVIFGGEKLEPRALAGWAAARRARSVHGERPALVNMYGITETTVHVTLRVLEDADLAAVHGNTSRSVIGVPLDDLELHVLDSDLYAVPEGAAGELCVSGAGLARGYLGRPALTAECFVPDPFGAPGGRLYRSGDLAIHDADGEIDYVGRNDFQVKIRGHRIETGEIRTCLLDHVDVRDAAVLAVEGPDGSQRLVAWVVFDAPAAVQAEVQGDWRATLRTHLGAALPAYMVPASFTRVAALPLTSNGKLDRAALLCAADVQQEGVASEQTPIAPHTSTQQRLVAIWQRVLGVESIGLRSHFFELGGDSLSTLRVAELARTAGFEGVAIGALFAHPVLEDLAAALDAQPHATRSTQSAELMLPRNFVRLNSGGASHTLFAIHPGYGLVAGYRALAKTLDGEAEVIGIEYPAYVDAAWHFGGLGALARDYHDAIRAVQPAGPYALLGWSFGGMLAVETACLLEEDGETVAFVGLLDSSIHAEASALSLDAPTRWRDAADPEELATLAARVPDWLAQTGDEVERGQGTEAATAHSTALLETAALAQANAALALRAHWPRAPRVPLSCWWAAHDTARPAADDAARWRDVGAQLRESREVPVVHDAIAWHPQVLAEVRAQLLADSASP